MATSAAVTVAVAVLVVLVLATTTADAQWAAAKPGACAPASVLQVCWLSCRSDYDCPTKDKCCPTACGGSVCSRPVSGTKPPTVKAGACPAMPTGPWVCSHRCTVDSDCRGSLKCCRNRCGALACQRPEPLFF